MTAFVSLPDVDSYPGISKLTHSKDVDQPNWRSFSVGFLALSLVIAIAGLIIYRYAKGSVTHEVTNNLEVIATLKTTEISYWLDEKKEDVHNVMRAEFEDPKLARNLQQWLRGGMHDPVLRGQVLDDLKRINEAHRYLEISLRSVQDGGLLLTTDEETDTAATRALALASAKSAKTTMEDFHMGTTGGVAKMHMGFLNTLRIGRRPQTAVVVDVTLDAGEVLFPMIQHWPGWNISAEILLLRREGNDVIVLNSLRKLPDSALHLRTPRTQTQSIMAEAMQTKGGTLRGTGFLGQPALAYTLSIPDTPWTLVAEVEERDAYAKLNTITTLISAFVALLMLSGVWWLLEHIRNTMARMRHETERKLLTTRINYLAKYANDCIMLCDALGHITDANDRCLSTYGYSHAELLGMNLCDLRTPSNRCELPTLLQRISEGLGLIYESEHQRKDGTTFNVEISACQIDIGGKPCYQAIIRDISVRKKLQMEREEHMHHLSDLTRRLVNFQEEERRHLSGELHDRIGANLATMNLNLRGIGKLLPTPRQQRLDDMLTDTTGLLADTIASIRDYCADLRPAILDYSGLIPALQELVQRYGKRHGTMAKFRQENMQGRLPTQTESMLFRITQEALTNCAKHSNAANVEVALSQLIHTTILTISDDGDGFDPALLGSKQVGLGLLTMRERAELADGKLFVISSPGKGTLIKVVVEPHETQQLIPAEDSEPYLEKMSA